MDPEETLKQIRDIVREMFEDDDKGIPPEPEGALLLASLVNGLDEWITSKGCLPKDWQKG